MPQLIENLPLACFFNSIFRGGTALFYYAGHAGEFGGENVLFPIDAIDHNLAIVHANAISLQDDILNPLAQSNQNYNIIIFDACRSLLDIKKLSIPEERFAAVPSSSIRSIARENIVLPKYSQNYLSFSAAPRSVAYDGDGLHSIFTQVLLEQIDKPANINILFQQVRKKVVQKTNGRQVPWSESSIVDNFYFKKPYFFYIPFYWLSYIFVFFIVFAINKNKKFDSTISRFCLLLGFVIIFAIADYQVCCLYGKGALAMKFNFSLLRKVEKSYHIPFNVLVAMQSLCTYFVIVFVAYFFSRRKK